MSILRVQPISENQATVATETRCKRSLVDLIVGHLSNVLTQECYKSALDNRFHERIEKNGSVLRMTRLH